MTTATDRLPLMRLHLERRDRHWWFTVGAVITLAIAIAMAVFGLPPVNLHSPLHKLGIIDPMCGGTRAARYAAQGNLAEAWRYNPLSIVIVYGAGLALLRAAVGLLGRRWVNVSLGWNPAQRRAVIAIGLAMLVLLEIRQQGRADLLMEGTQTWR